MFESVQVHEDQDRAGYAIGDLQWLQLQFRPRHALTRADSRTSNEEDPAASGGGTTSLASRFAGSGLTHVISETDKLRRVGARRQRYLEWRGNEGVVDLLLRLRSEETIFAYIRTVESKGVSYWYRRTGRDYKENWLLQYTPVRRYHEGIGD